MSKTDKELTVEVVNSYITTYLNNYAALTEEELQNLIKKVYNTISTLEKF